MLEGPILGLVSIIGILSCIFYYSKRFLFERSSYSLSLGLRNNKEFRAYDLTPGRPIQGPNNYDLDVALNSLERNENEDARDVDLESECSDLSDLTDLDDDDDDDDSDGTPIHTWSSLSPKSWLTSFLGPTLCPFQKSPEAELSDSEAEDIPIPCSTKIAETGKKARRKRKKIRNRNKRRQRRKVEQEALGTQLKNIARRRAAESQKLDAGESFVSKDLPVNSGGWSGLRQQFEKINPGISELLGDDYDMQLVNWNGK